MSQNQDVLILRRAIKILSKPGAWTKGALARSKSDVDRQSAERFRVSVTNRNAVCFCAVGAINRASYELGYETSKDYDAFNGAFNFPTVRKVNQNIFPRRLQSLNDARNTSLSKIISILEDTIKKIEAGSL